MEKYTGIFPALITPFKSDGNINEKALEKIIERNIRQGVSGFYASGSTGESFLMSKDQRMHLFKSVVKIVNGRCPIIANIGMFSTTASIELAEYAAKLGINAISAVPPFYYPYNKKEIKYYYSEIQNAVGLPMIIYNVPALSGVSFATSDLVELLNTDQIAGIKQTTYDLYQTEELVLKFPGKSVFIGHDEIFLPSLSIGVRAIIGSTLSIMADKYMEIWNSFHKGDMENASYIQGKVNSMITTLLEVGIFKGIKAILEMQGIECGVCMRPFQPLNTEELSKLDRAYQELKK